MASKGMPLPGAQPEKSGIGEEVFSPDDYQRKVGGRGGSEPPTQTGDSGSSGSGGFLRQYWWKLLLPFLALAACLASFWFVQHPTWRLYLLAELLAVFFGIWGGGCWIRYDRALVKNVANPEQADLDQLGFFNSRLARRNGRLFQLATKELTHGMQPAPHQRLVELLSRHWKDETPKTEKPSPIDSASDEELMKILQPEYAIGMRIISRDDYTSQMNQYFAQSELSLGIIVPLILVVLGLALTPQLGLRCWAWVIMCLVLAVTSGILFVIGMERWQKYRMELKLLILGNWERLQKEANKDKAPNENGGAASKALQTAIVNAIDKATTQPGAVKVDINIKP